MKKVISKFNVTLFRNAVLIIFVMALFAACRKDEPLKENEELIFETVEYSVPTEDALNVVSNLPTYVFAYNYQNFGAALVNRMQNRVAEVNDETMGDLASVVLHSSQIESLEEEWSVILMQLLLGHNIIIIEPTVNDFKYFCTITTLVYSMLSESEAGRELLDELDIISGTRQTLEAFYEMGINPSKVESMFLLDTDETGVFAEAIAVRGCDFHIVDRMIGVANTETSYEQIVDEEGTTEPTDAPEVGDKETSEAITAYSYGLFADMFTKWINEHKYYNEIEEQVRRRAMESLGPRASDTTKYNVEEISTVQKVEYTISASIPYNLGPHLPVTVSFEICSIYMENEDCDYYCVYKNILSYNNALDCGPSGDSNKRKWRQADHFGYYDYKKDEDVGIWTMYKYYGPFMRDIEGRSICHAHTSDFMDSSRTIVDLPSAGSIKSVAGVAVKQYSPKNSIGSIDKTDGFSYGFDGGLCMAKDPSVNFGFGLSWDTSTTQTIEDLEIIASTLDGVPEWKYVGHNLPDAYYNLIVECSHSDAPSIMRRECEVDQSWIWRVPNPTGSYRLYDETKVTTAIMYYTTGVLKAYANYANNETIKRASFLMMPPPRSQQMWMMNVNPYSDELNSMLAMTHNRFWNKDNHEFALNDTTDDSRISIEQFINDFQRDLKSKRHTWKNRNFTGTFTFSYYNVDDENNEPISFEFVVE